MSSAGAEPDRDVRVGWLRRQLLPVSVAVVLIAGLGVFSWLTPEWTSDLRARGEAYTEHRAASERKRIELSTRFDQAAAMLHLKEYDHAVTALHRVLELAPEMPEAHANMGFALLGRGDAKAASDFFRSAIALRADQGNAHYGLALALHELADDVSAIQSMRIFVHLASPADPFRAKGADLLEQWNQRLDEQRESSGLHSTK